MLTKIANKETNLAGKIDFKQKVTGVMVILKGQVQDPVGMQSPSMAVGTATQKSGV